MNLPSANRILLSICLLGMLPCASVRAASQMECLDRGLVALRTGGTSVLLSWRSLGTDPPDTRFNVYRATGDSTPVKIAELPNTSSTQFTDTTAELSQPNSYFVRPVFNDVGQAPGNTALLPADSPTRQYFNLPLDKPADVTGSTIGDYTYSASDCSTADLDGDGQYEIIVKWDPSNSQDNSVSGYTGNVYLDAYQLDGTKLWRIDLGRNIRAGAHYTQFIAYDLDGDGRAEIACKTADATVSGTGQVIGDPNADHRNASGYILSGPEYLTLFDGLTGAILTTVDYVVPRGTVSSWGDSYGNRVDRFLAGVAYLDGQRPSLVMCRGYYTRAALAAFDWRGGQLTQRWVFDTGNSTTGALAAYRGQGAHSLTVGDVDADGRDEIVYGACAIDDNGTGLYSTGLGHGDALHLSDMDPSRPGLEVWMVHETPSLYGTNGSELHDAATGQILYGVSGEGVDIGRGVAADIDPTRPGFETWSSRGGLWNVDGTQITTSAPGPKNFLCWWDGDLLRELLDGTTISKWDWVDRNIDTLLSPSGLSSNNTTKATPCLSADLFGDWREEVVWRTTDSTSLRIYTTTIPTSHRIPTLMHDRQYRCAIAWQNVGYNQPPHTGYFLGQGMSPPPAPVLAVVTPPGSPPPVATRFPNWLVSRGLSAGLPPDLDHDHDGRDLFTEYAFGLVPQNPVILQGGHVVLGVPNIRDELDYRIERSSDLKSWTTIATVPGQSAPSEIQLPVGTGTEFFRVATDSAPAAASPVQTTYPAENALAGPGASVFESTNPGFHGTGYINSAANGSYIEFNGVNGGAGGNATLAFRYALGVATSRTGRLIVNGVQQNITFTPSGAWSTWLDHSLNVTLLPGTANTIRLETTGQDLANIDELTVTTGP